jgi:3',5'-cyclic AMP phosphodiesterase CpdA
VAFALLAGCAPIASLTPPGMIAAVPPGATAPDADPHHLGDVVDAPDDSLIVLLAGDNRPGYRMQSQRIGYPQLSAFSPGAPGTWLPALGALPLAIVQVVVPTLDGFQDLATGLITHRPNGGGEAQVRDAMTRRLPADLVMNTGDLVFDGRRAQLWRDFERKFGTPEGPRESLRAGRPFLSAPGNHERIHTAEGRANWIAVMGAPPRPERFWFAVDAGGDLARFVFLDSNVLANVHGVYAEERAEALAREQLDWLDRILDSGARYRFVVLHHPPVMVGNHGGDWLPEASARRRDRVLEICARRGVTAVLGGHEHLYHRVYARGPAAGFWIITTGGAGGPLHRIDREVREREYARTLPAGLALDPTTARIESRHHFMRLVLPSAAGHPPYVEVYGVNRRGEEVTIEHMSLAPPR